MSRKLPEAGNTRRKPARVSGDFGAVSVLESESESSSLYPELVGRRGAWHGAGAVGPLRLPGNRKGSTTEPAPARAVVIGASDTISPAPSSPSGRVSDHAAPSPARPQTSGPGLRVIQGEGQALVQAPRSLRQKPQVCREWLRSALKGPGSLLNITPSPRDKAGLFLYDNQPRSHLLGLDGKERAQGTWPLIPLENGFGS